MTNDVRIRYSEYGSTAVIDKAEFELVEDMLMTLTCNKDKKQVSVSMSDMVSDNTELEGILSYDKLCVLIRILSQLRNQLKD